jgi:hypothetical protein
MYTPEYNDPAKWLERISFYTGLLEELAKHYTVESIEQINYNGKLQKIRQPIIFSISKKRNFTFHLSSIVILRT